jgi:hypothetical protein
MKTAISIPDRVFQAAEEAAKRLSMSRSELRRVRETHQPSLGDNVATACEGLRTIRSEIH